MAVSAIFISAISLWAAFDTVRTNRQLSATNRQLVVEASWPFVQIYASGGGLKVLSLNIGNAGAGPAKIETFDLFWNGKPYRSSDDQMKVFGSLRDSSWRIWRAVA